MKWSERMKYWLYMALFMPLAWMPLPLLYRLSNLLRGLFQHIIKYRRRVVRDNLQSCFPDKTSDELRRIEVVAVCSGLKKSMWPPLKARSVRLPTTALCSYTNFY